MADSRLGSYLAKWRGAGAAGPAALPARQILLAGLGGALALAVVAGLAAGTGLPCILGSLGASCVLVFGFPDVPFSQPRAVIGGHVVAAAIGVAAVQLFGPTWWSVALATGAAIMAMMALRIVHPPAGSNPVIAVTAAAHWDFVAVPAALGALLIVLVGLVYLNLVRPTRWPARW